MRRLFCLMYSHYKFLYLCTLGLVINMYLTLLLYYLSFLHTHYMSICINLNCRCVAYRLIVMCATSLITGFYCNLDFECFLNFLEILS